ncbi:MAG: DUF1848 domain-containing protein [Candidatus Eiseniibacteriota bacterium]
MPRTAEIISASRRTDVPAFHTRWFLNRLRAGWCHWIHPYTGVVRRVSLVPEDVEAIVFWTRWPVPLLRHIAAISADGYTLAFQFTITGYGPPIESHNPPEERAVAAFEKLSRAVGAEAVLWRYDPVVLSPEMTPDWHVESFARVARRLSGLTRRCTFSFVDFYGKTQRNLRKVEEASGTSFGRPDTGEKQDLARRLGAIAGEHGMAMLSCCDDALVGGPVGKSRCVDPDLVAALRGGVRLTVPPRPTRPDCGCVRSVDIGCYDSCAFGCAYCYATSSRGAARKRLAEADPEDSVLWRPPSLRGVDLGREAALAPATAQV